MAKLATLNVTISARISDVLRLPQETGVDLGVQLWAGTETPTEAGFRVVDDFGRTCANKKPRGGLWTSTLVGEAASDWLRWCEQEDLDDPKTIGLWMLTPKANARILRIDSYEDLQRVLSAYPHHPYPYLPDDRVIAFDRVMADGWDGIHLTEEGQWKTRLSHPDNLYGWDCESTVWLRWAFEGNAVLVREHQSPS